MRGFATIGDGEVRRYRMRVVCALAGVIPRAGRVSAVPTRVRREISIAHLPDALTVAPANPVN